MTRGHEQELSLIMTSPDFSSCITAALMFLMKQVRFPNMSTLRCCPGPQRPGAPWLTPPPPHLCLLCKCAELSVQRQDVSMLQSLTWFTVVLWLSSVRFSEGCAAGSALTWFDWRVDAYQWSERLPASCVLTAASFLCCPLVSTIGSETQKFKNLFVSLTHGAADRHQRHE